MNQSTALPSDSPDMLGGGNILVVGSGQLSLENEVTELWMPDGRVLRVPTALLITPPPAMAAAGELGAAAEQQGAEAETISIPVVEERLTIGKRTVNTGKVRLKKTVQEYEEALNEPLAVRTFDVERVILNRVVDEAPLVRYEGDTTIYPLVEERLILTKQLLLLEEVRVTKRDTERVDTQVVVLRREHLSVEREPLEAK